MKRGISISDEDDGLSVVNYEQLVMEANSPDRKVQLQAVQAARKLLSCEKNPPIDNLIRHGILPVLVQCLQIYDK